MRRLRLVTESEERVQPQLGRMDEAACQAILHDEKVLSFYSHTEDVKYSKGELKEDILRIFHFGCTDDMNRRIIQENNLFNVNELEESTNEEAPVAEIADAILSL